MNAHAKDRALYDAIIRNLGSGNTVAEAMAKNRQRGGIFVDHARTLRRAQLTLHRWSEEMCNGTIQREGPDGDGKPVRVWIGQLWSFYAKRMEYTERRTPCPDREAGALRRIKAVCDACGLKWYHQTDPRGCSLYVGAEALTDQNYSSKGIPCL